MCSFIRETTGQVSWKSRQLAQSTKMETRREKATEPVSSHGADKQPHGEGYVGASEREREMHIQACISVQKREIGRGERENSEMQADLSNAVWS